MKPDSTMRLIATAVVAMLGVAGCSAATSSQAVTSAGVPTTVVSSTTVPVSDTTTASSRGAPAGLTPAADPWARAEQLSLVSPDGQYVGPVDSNGEPLLFEPITGYGNFSGQDRFDVDSYQVVQLLAECVADHGFPLTVTGDGTGLTFQAVPPDQNQLAQAVLFACKAGLRLEKPAPPTVDQLEEAYAYMVAVAHCLEEEGYSVTDPPSVGVYIDSQGYWNPYDDLVAGLQEWSRLNQKCPQNPVGGYGAWDPGDPVRPVPAP